MAPLCLLKQRSALGVRMPLPEPHRLCKTGRAPAVRFCSVLRAESDLPVRFTAERETQKRGWGSGKDQNRCRRPAPQTQGLLFAPQGWGTPAQLVPEPNCAGKRPGNQRGKRWGGPSRTSAVGGALGLHHGPRPSTAPPLTLLRSTFRRRPRPQALQAPPPPTGPRDHALHLASFTLRPGLAGGPGSSRVLPSSGRLTSTFGQTRTHAWQTGVGEA